MARTPMNFVHPRPPLRARIRSWLHRHLFTAILWLCVVAAVLAAVSAVAGW